MKENIETTQTIRLLRWIRRHGGLWYLICTPNEEHMSPQMMRARIDQLAKESFYEMIFVLLTVHRHEEYVESFFGYTLLDLMIDHWAGNKDEMIKRFITHFE